MVTKSCRKALIQYAGIIFSIICLTKHNPKGKAKSLEKIVCNQVSAFMTKNGVFSEYQYGFRKARSCSDLLVATIDDWHLAQDANKFTAIAFIDLSKAFDNVRHATLLLMLQKFGLGGTVLQWFFNYLFNRQQRIHLQVPFTRSKGVPRGECSWPAAFQHLCVRFSWLGNSARRSPTVICRRLHAVCIFRVPDRSLWSRLIRP